MRPIEGEGPWHEFLGTTKKNNPFVQSGPFHIPGTLRKPVKPAQPADSRIGGPPKGGYGNRNWFNYKPNEDRNLEETRDMNRGRSGLKRGIDIPEQKRSAIQRRLHPTRNT